MHKSPWQPRWTCSALMAGTLLLASSWCPAAEDSTAKNSTAKNSTAKDSTRAQPDPRDWPMWRGPEGNNVSRETGLPDKWNFRGGPGSNVKWINSEVAGRSTPIVMHGKLYTIVCAEQGTERENEKVVCVDAETGKLLWENRFNVWSSDVPVERVGWSSVVGDPETGHVYALGVCGYFLCLNGETGKTLWSRALHDEFGLLSTYGGRTNFPVLCDDLVLISGVVIGWGEMARPTHRFLAFDKKTGDLVWFNGTRPLPEDTTYSTPALAVLGGQKALVFGSGDGALWAFQPRTGKPIWEYRMSRRGMDVSPLVDGDTVYMAHSEENIVGTTMGALVAIDGTGKGDVTETATRWRLNEFTMGKASPVLAEGRLYCIDDSAKLQVFDAQSGEPIGRAVSLGTMGRATPLYADGKLYALEANGRWFILAPDEKQGVKILSRGRLGSAEECLASPICAHGKIYILTTAGLYCLEDEQQEHGLQPRPETADEPAAGDDPEPALAQVVPAEALLKPGEKLQFTVRLFNSKGQALGESPASFQLQGPGEITPAGDFTAPADTGHTATIVQAKVGDLVGSARIRIVPPLPWSFDFEQLADPPITWVGARYRHIIRQENGNKVMVKITTIPKGTRSRCWFGPFELHDYTIEADVRGAGTDNKQPDIGLICQGYTMSLVGNAQKLQVLIWDSQPDRLEDSIDFAWKPDQWYHMKLRVVNQPESALVQGKVWEQGKPEPADWMVEVEDTFPNRSGSPGLFGNATNAEIFLDNIRVTAND